MVVIQTVTYCWELSKQQMKITSGSVRKVRRLLSQNHSFKPRTLRSKPQNHSFKPRTLRSKLQNLSFNVQHLSSSGVALRWGRSWSNSLWARYSRLERYGGHLSLLCSLRTFFFLMCHLYFLPSFVTPSVSYTRILSFLWTQARWVIST